MANGIILKVGGDKTGIISADCTSTQADVLSGTKTIMSDSNDEVIEGIMPNNGDWTGTVGMNESITVPKGYHSGDGKVNGPTITQQGSWSGSVAMNGHITVPEGYHNGQGNVAGPTITDRGAWNGNVAMNSSVIIPEGYHNGSGKVTGPAVTQRGAWTGRLGINGRIAIPEGYHNGAGYVDQAIATQGALTLNPGTTAKTGAVSGKYMTGNVTVPAVSIPNTYIRKDAVITFPDGSKSSVGTYCGDSMQENQNFWYIGSNYGVDFSGGTVSGDRWILPSSGSQTITFNKDFYVSGWHRLRLGGNFSPGNTEFILNLKINGTLKEHQRFTWSEAKQWFDIQEIRKITAGSVIRIYPRNGGLYLLHIYVENYGW